MKKLLMILSVSMIVLTVFTSCGSRHKMERGSSKSDGELMSETKIPKTLKKELGDNLRVNAAIDAPETLPRSVRKIPARIKVLENQEEVIKLIFRDEPTTKSTSQGAKDREGNSYETERLKSASGKRLQWYGKVMNFSSELGLDINEAFTLSEDGDKYPARDLPFMKQEEAKQKGREFLKLLGVSVEENVLVNSLDYGTMARMQTEKYNEFKAATSGNMAKKIRPLRKWSKDDDCYALQFKQAIDGISISSQTFGGAREKTETFGPDIKLYYGKQGYVSGTIGYIYEETGSSEQYGTPLSLDSAFSVLQNKFDEIIMDNPITITNIEFSYVPKLAAANKEDYVLTPCWIFQLSQYSKDIQEDIKTRIIIDALTGKEVE